MKKFIRTRGAPPAAAPAPASPPPAPAPRALNGEARKNKTNGHTNGAAPAHDDLRSTLSSRYWSDSSGGGGAGGGGGGGAAWCDEQFPADWRALGSRRLGKDVEWLRPCELTARPAFWRGPRGDDDDEDLDRWRAGAEGWLVPGVCAAAAALAHTPRLLQRALCAPQPLHGASCDHRIRFQFWVWGAWREVVVDDRLPARRGRPLSRAVAATDYTLPLLEKAYAKLYGSYSAARAAPLAHALQELSGGVVQALPLPAPAPAPVLHSALPRSTLVFATLKSGRRGSAAAARGLVPGQPYLVTGLARAGAGAGAGLVRARGAWGLGVPRGAWGAGGDAWRALAPPDRDLLARRLTRTAEFWLSLEELSAWFGSLVLVHLGPDSWLAEGSLRGRRPWRAVLARRRLVPGHSAGGPPRCRATHSANPQFHLQIPAAAEAEAEAEDTCHVVVSVMRQYWLGGGGGRGAEVELGFALYALPRAASRLAPLPLHDLRPLDVSHAARGREVAALCRLPAGDYRLVPHAQRPHQPAALLLRILTDRHAHVWEVNEDNVMVGGVAAALLGGAQLPPEEQRRVLQRLFGDRDVDDLELDAAALDAALRAAGAWRGGAWRGGAWRGCWRGAPPGLLRTLVALHDPSLRGSLPARALPPLLPALHYWRASFLRVSRGGWLPGYRLRALLDACGVRASNKVLEALSRRHAPPPRRALTLPRALHALAQLHLAHQRFRALDGRAKNSPVALEEMILMTIYS